MLSKAGVCKSWQWISMNWDAKTTVPNYPKLYCAREAIHNMSEHVCSPPPKSRYFLGRGESPARCFEALLAQQAWSQCWSAVTSSQFSVAMGCVIKFLMGSLVEQLSQLCLHLPHPWCHVWSQIWGRWALGAKLARESEVHHPCFRGS